MPELPLVSVVVPVFNGARHLRESLDSILAQTYLRTEIVVMDDASTDATPAIVASYGERVRAHRQDVNRGIYDNVNDGLALARGEFVAVYHADDVYLPAIVEREVGFLLRHPEAGAVFCLDSWIDVDGREYGRLEIPPEVSGGEPLPFDVVLNACLRHKNRFLVCPTAMVRASVYRELGGYRQSRFRNSADLDMWLRIARHGPIGVLEEHLVRYRHSETSSSSRYHLLRTEPEGFFAIMDHHLAAGARARARPDALEDYEAHRAADRLLIAQSLYIEGRLAAARAALGAVDARRIARSGRVERLRLLALLVLLHALTRLPRIPPAAEALYRRRRRSRLGRRPFARARAKTAEAR